MVRIRLRRMGAHKRPFYRIIAADSRCKRDGRFIETLGYYDPLTEPATVKVDAGKYQQWLRNGAQPSETVAAILKRSGALEAAAQDAQPITPMPTATEAPAAQADAAKEAAPAETASA